MSFNFINGNLCCGGTLWHHFQGKNTKLLIQIWGKEKWDLTKSTNSYCSFIAQVLVFPFLQSYNFSLCYLLWWLLTMREKHRLRVVENRVLRRIFRPKRDEVTGE
jgi:hypothetical protein